MINVKLSKADWMKIIVLAELGASYDSDGCSSSYDQEAEQGDPTAVAVIDALNSLRYQVQS